jgi:hypothetical protein
VIAFATVTSILECALAVTSILESSIRQARRPDGTGQQQEDQYDPEIQV